MDRLDKEQRSWNMSKVKGKNTAPEILVRKYLYSRGIRYRLHANLPGRPDIVIAKNKIAVFVHGCFWHGHKNCKDFRLPKTNTDFWRQKISGNIQRDKKNRSSLERSGWNVVVIWECELGNNRDSTFYRLTRQITSVGD